MPTLIPLNFGCLPDSFAFRRGLLLNQLLLVLDSLRLGDIVSKFRFTFIKDLLERLCIRLPSLANRNEKSIFHRLDYQCPTDSLDRVDMQSPLYRILGMSRRRPDAEDVTYKRHAAFIDG